MGTKHDDIVTRIGQPDFRLLDVDRSTCHTAPYHQVQIHR
jgi:hypothetical protein